MRRTLSTLVGLAAAAAFATALATAGTAHATTPILLGSVGPGFTISLKGPDGKVVKTLKAGRYTISIHDQASIHDFHLTGPGLDKVITGVGFVGSKKLTITLAKGTYRYRCDPHAPIMHGSFTVS
jgi:Copper binding proteins, plastocyanin/azurin family